MNIIITGASRGIGFETLKNIAVSGEHKILAISRNIESIESSLKFFVNNKSEIKLLNLDLEKEWDYFDKIDGYFGLSKGNKIDILINNAGMLIAKSIDKLSIEDWQRTFNLNLFAVANMVKLLYNYFAENSNSHIVNIGSMGGFQSSKKFADLIAYSAAKAAVHNLTESLAEDLKSKKISVNALALGAVQTDMLEQAFPGVKAKVNPEQMGAFIADFALNSSKLFNGKVIPVSLDG